MTEQLSTEQKFVAYEDANAAGGGDPSRKLWESFSPRERELWREQAGSLMPVPLEGMVVSREPDNTR